MKSLIWSLAALMLLSSPVSAKAPEPGKTAPDFELSDVTGKVHRLSAYRGKIVVLEWTNPGCPYVKKHYGSGNMQKLQEEYARKGVVWLSICSSAPGKQGHLTPEEGRAQVKKDRSKAAGLLLDPTGKVGRLYDARTTPHLFVVDAKGLLAYQGAIDDRPTFLKGDVKKAKSYVRAALDALLNGQLVAEPSTKPYGCSVKY